MMKKIRQVVFYLLALSLFLSGNNLFSIPAVDVIEEIEINETEEENEESTEGRYRYSITNKKLSGSSTFKILKSLDAEFYSTDYFYLPIPLYIIGQLPFQVYDQFLQKQKLFILYSRLKLDC